MPQGSLKTRGGKCPSYMNRHCAYQFLCVSVLRLSFSGCLQCLLLQGGQFTDAFLGKGDKLHQLVRAECRAFCRALDFDDFFRIQHHDVHITVAARIFGIIQI